MTEVSRNTRLVAVGAILLGAAAAWLSADAEPLPAPAQYAPGLGGLVVHVDGEPVGRLIGYLHGLAQVDLAEAAPQSGSVLVGQAASLDRAPLLEVISPTGYVFHVSTGSVELPSREGELHRRVSIFYDAPQCGGQAYLPIQNESGRFSTWEPGNGLLRPVVGWAARQGLVFQSPDPADPTPVYMTRRGAAVEDVVLRSIRLVVIGASPPAAVCISPPFPQDIPDRAVRVEALDPAVAGVAGTLGGEITLGW